MTASANAPDPGYDTPTGCVYPDAYVKFFACFNRADYFEAHEVLEPLWLDCRTQPIGHFYKGLIQLAGAFVHVRKGRTKPALALLRSAAVYLGRYGASYAGLSLRTVLESIANWETMLAAPGDLEDSRRITDAVRLPVPGSNTA